MKIKVLAFGVAKEIFAGHSIDVDMAASPATAAALKTLLEDRYPRLKLLSSFMLAVNNEYASGEEIINADDEIAVIPPVSGG